MVVPRCMAAAASPEGEACLWRCETPPPLPSRGLHSSGVGPYSASGCPAVSGWALLDHAAPCRTFCKGGCPAVRTSRPSGSRASLCLARSSRPARQPRRSPPMLGRPHGGCQGCFCRRCFWGCRHGGHRQSPPPQGESGVPPLSRGGCRGRCCRPQPQLPRWPTPQGVRLRGRRVSGPFSARDKNAAAAAIVCSIHRRSHCACAHTGVLHATRGRASCRRSCAWHRLSHTRALGATTGGRMGDK